MALLVAIRANLFGIFLSAVGFIRCMEDEMKREFLMERGGKQFALYAGLLDLAHQNGLVSISTELVQVPSEANYHTAICTAVVVLEQGGVRKQFSGIGDAARTNVSGTMAQHLIRMAETRAKARALRDAVNIGVAAFEELGDEEETQPAPQNRQRQQAPPSRRVASTEQASGQVTPAQLNAIANIAQRNGINPDALNQWVASQFDGLTTEGLTFVEAGEVIRRLSKGGTR